MPEVIQVKGTNPPIYTDTETGMLYYGSDVNINPDGTYVTVAGAVAVTQADLQAAQEAYNQSMQSTEAPDGGWGAVANSTASTTTPLPPVETSTGETGDGDWIWDGTTPVWNSSTGQYEYGYLVNTKTKEIIRAPQGAGGMGPVANPGLVFHNVEPTIEDTGTGSNDDGSGNNGWVSGGGYGSNGGYGGSSGYPAGFGNSSDNPVPTYANGWVPPMFGGQYTYQEWLAMHQPPDDGYSGPAQLPDLPWWNSQPAFDPFNGNPPGNPFNQSSGSGAGADGVGLARSLYQKFAGKFAEQTSGDTASPTQADYNRSEAKARRDAKKREQEYQDQQLIAGMQSRPEWGMTDLWGKDFAYNPAFSYYQNAYPLAALQNIIGGDVKYKKLSDPNKYKRHLADMYREISGGTGALTYNSLRDNIFDASRGSWLGRSFQSQTPGKSRYSDDGIYRGWKDGKWKWNGAADQASQAQFLMGGLHQSTLAPAQANFRNTLVEQALAGWGGSQSAKKNPGSVLRYLKRQGF